MNTSYKLDTMIKVDESLCITCGACIRACPGGLITKKDFPVPIENGWDLCIDCGHCVAICPTGAMHQRSMGPEDCEEIDIHLIPRWDRVRQYLISRRSIRGYIKQAHRKGEDPAAAGCGPLCPERREPPGDTLGRDQRSGEGSPDRRDDHRLDEGREGKEPGALRGSQTGIVCRAVGVRPGSHFPGSAVHHHGLCPER